MDTTPAVITNSWDAVLAPIAVEEALVTKLAKKPYGRQKDMIWGLLTTKRSGKQKWKVMNTRLVVLLG